MRIVKLAATFTVALAALLVVAPRPAAQSFAAPAGVVPAPDPNIPLYFEVASIKRSDPGSQGQNIRRQPGGRFSTLNMPLRPLIAFAYQIQSYQLVGGPSWLANDRFDIVAKMEGDPPAVIPGTGADHMMLAVRTLLADRFKLVVRRETRELDIYALTMARPGGKPGKALKPASGDCSPEAFAARRGGPPPAAGAPPQVCGIQQTMGGFASAGIRCHSSPTVFRVRWGVSSSIERGSQATGTLNSPSRRKAEARPRPSWTCRCRSIPRHQACSRRFKSSSV
jgi:uncharacterized protein (TIGR03435 family)